MQARIRNPAGMILVSTLLLISVLLMLLAAALQSARRGSFTTQTRVTSVSGLYVAESALAEMKARFKADPDWESDLVAVKTPFEAGEYTILFSNTESVNNLNGSGAKPGPYGDVQPGTILLRIHATVQERVRTVDVVLSRNAGPTPASGEALLGTGEVKMLGGVSLTGVAGYGDSTSVNADLISTSTADHSGMITWQPIKAGDSATITGTVEVPGSSPLAIQLGSASVGARSRPSSPRTPPAVDILGEIAINRSHPPLPVPTPGSAVPAGRYSVSGDSVYQGDLVLDGGVDLYVYGDFTVNGSITGEGSVYVSGKTTLKGSSAIASSADSSVALFSHDSVELTGFDGTEYIDQLAANAGGDFPQLWENTKRDGREILQEISEPDYSFSLHSPADYRMQSLGQNTSDGHPNGANASVEADKLSRMSALLSSQPPSPTQKFLQDKFAWLRKPVPGEEKSGGVFGFHGQLSDQGLLQAVRDIQSGLKTDALFDAVNDLLAKAVGVDAPGYALSAADLDEFGGEQALRGLLVNSLRAISLDRPGTSYFQGKIVTHGWFYAGHEVSIIGNVAAVGDPTILASSPTADPSLTLHSGDIRLEKGTQVTYFDDVVNAAGGTSRPLRVQHWLSH